MESGTNLQNTTIISLVRSLASSNALQARDPPVVGGGQDSRIGKFCRCLELGVANLEKVDKILHSYSRMKIS